MDPILSNMLANRAPPSRVVFPPTSLASDIAFHLLMGNWQDLSEAIVIVSERQCALRPCLVKAITLELAGENGCSLAKRVGIVLPLDISTLASEVVDELLKLAPLVH